MRFHADVEPPMEADGGGGFEFASLLLDSTVPNTVGIAFVVLIFCL